VLGVIGEVIPPVTVVLVGWVVLIAVFLLTSRGV
jgi:hypothetical protein